MSDRRYASIARGNGSAGASWRPAILVACVLALVWLSTRPAAPPRISTPASASAATTVLSTTQPQQQGGGASDDGSPKLDGTYEDIDGSEVVWQKPPKTAVGVLLVLHGCGHYAGDWFPRTAACPRCLGLPEELLITRAGLARRLAVVAISSLDRGTKCWDPRPTSDDAEMAERVLVALARREPSLSGLPVYAFGASSGGAFALALGARGSSGSGSGGGGGGGPALAGVIAEIMGHPLLSAWVAGSAAGAKAPKYKFPPTALIHMPRDADTAALVAANAAELRAAGVPVRVSEVHPAKVTAAWLAAKVPELRGNGNGSGGSGSVSPLAEAVAAAFQKAGITDADGALKTDPRRAPWRAAVAAVPGGGAVPTAADESALSEVMNLAWAAHEMAGEPVAGALDWLLSLEGGVAEGKDG